MVLSESGGNGNVGSWKNCDRKFVRRKSKFVELGLVKHAWSNKTIKPAEGLVLREPRCDGV